MPDTQRKSGEEVVRGYEEYARTPHGRLRHDLLLRHYAEFLTRHPASWMVDLGGGAGLLLAGLAQRFPALRMVLADDDKAMVRAARERLTAAGAGGRTEARVASHRDLPSLVAGRGASTEPCLISFNHAIEYVEDPESVLRGLAGAVPPGSFLGIMYLNNSHEALRRVWHKDSISGFLTQLETGDFDSVNFGAARAIRTERLHAALDGCGLRQVEEFGLRCFAEWKSKEFVEARYAEVLEAEAKVASHPDFVGLARYRLRFYRRP